MVFAALEIIGGLIFIGFGATALVGISYADENDIDEAFSQYRNDHLSEHDRREQNRFIIAAGKVVAIVLIVFGVLALLNGIIGVVGAAKDHKCLLIFHTVLLSLSLLGICYYTFTMFSVQNLFGLLFTIVRVGMVIYLLQMIKLRQRIPSHPKNVAV